MSSLSKQSTALLATVDALAITRVVPSQTNRLSTLSSVTSTSNAQNPYAMLSCLACRRITAYASRTEASHLAMSLSKRGNVRPWWIGSLPAGILSTSNTSNSSNALPIARTGRISRRILLRSLTERSLLYIKRYYVGKDLEIVALDRFKSFHLGLFPLYL
jgi:hypothetical protein